VTNIYVGNLSFSATDQDIRQAFEAFGQVSQVNIIIDRETGRSRGFAFVEMPNSAQAQQAIEKLNQSEIGGRSVVVNEARPKTDRGGGGGGGGGRGGGGGVLVAPALAAAARCGPADAGREPRGIGEEGDSATAPGDTAGPA
jgi:RNA recognition motif-containing protein